MSWFSKVEAEFKKLFTNAPTWEQIASGALTVAGPLVEIVVALAAGTPAEVAVAKVISIVQTDMATAKVVLQGVSGSGVKQQLASLITSINTNLQSLLQMAEVKNSAKIAEITEAVNGISAELQAIIQVA